MQKFMRPGSHYYQGITYIGSRSHGITVEIVFQALRLYAAPTTFAFPGYSGPASRPVSTGDISVLAGGTMVVHNVDPESLTVTNITLDPHILHPGVVFRQVVEIDNDIYVITRGYGSGHYPLLNSTFGPAIFRGMDVEIASYVRGISPMKSHIENALPLAPYNSFPVPIPSNRELISIETGGYGPPGSIAATFEGASVFGAYHQSLANEGVWGAHNITARFLDDPLLPVPAYPETVPLDLLAPANPGYDPLAQVPAELQAPRPGGRLAG